MSRLSGQDTGGGEAYPEEGFHPDNLRAFFDRHARVFMPINGSLESILLAHACREWAHKLTLLLVRTNAQLGAVVDVAKAFALWFPLIELQGMQPLESWQRFGIASDLVAVPPRGKPVMQPWTDCCARVRQRPLVEFLRKKEGEFGLLDPSRYERQFGDIPGRGELSERHEVFAPFWGLSDYRIESAVVKLDLRVPRVVACSADPLACGGCAARMTPERLAYLRETYPVEAATVERMTKIALSHVGRIASSLHALLPRETEAQEPEITHGR